MTIKSSARLVFLASVLCSLTLIAFAAPQQEAPAKKATVAQKSFATPEAAGDALLKAAADYDVPALLDIFGPDGKSFIQGADPVRDKNAAEEFGKLGATKHSIQTDPAKPTQATLIVGDQDWPFPIPLVKRSGKWSFDTKKGKMEVLYRRIGTNELDAIAACKGYVRAQHEYAETRHDGAMVNQYAQKIMSTSGKQDGLQWKNADGSNGGPISEAVAKAIAEGYSFAGDKPSPFHGYYFKILKGQGPSAPLGRIDYVIQGAMIGGFALVAVPAEYRVTGVKTFIVNQSGVVYQKDLGPDSLKIAKDMELYNPDKTWLPTDDEWPDDAETAANN
ncbi:conserved hypothetical protein [Candidatus Koribacter versatilis Ellin345]|uniref:DUF2950 domain-containing protein n=1 Tax=Koribacter versatilis (strain Ellin345) TaxID=204669 RepID=Q1IJ72_KORVE|nr:DUF2950 domain-containing protein [Candidatus Koribacter versatilis]ABF43078.1 conserved hypothetical protein [Candidatus Koribacter versatilis Ellin345]